MITSYQRSDLIEEAVTAAAQRHQIDRDTICTDLDVITTDLASVDTKIDRYLTAFSYQKAQVRHAVEATGECRVVSVRGALLSIGTDFGRRVWPLFFGCSSLTWRPRACPR